MLFRALFLALAITLGTGASCVRGGDQKTEQAGTSLTIVSSTGEHRFRIELADSDEKRTQGLMYRTEIADDAGMLFDFGPTPRPVSMWMKNTIISLDMAFIAADGRITNIAERTTPYSLNSIRSDGDVLAVLEVRGGRLVELGVKPGDRVRHPLFKGE
jgi:hypothetical protein